MYLYMGSKTALCSSTWPLCTSTWALQTDLWSQETSKRLPGPGAISDLSGRLWKPKNAVKYMVFAVFHVAPQTRPDRPNQPPGRPRSGPGRPRSGPKTAPRAPKASQERPQSRPKTGLGGQVGPTWHKRAVRRPPGDHFGPPTGRFCTLRGSISYTFLLSESIAKAVL